MYTLENLQKMKGTELKSLCVNYGIKKSGNKPDLINRIMEFQCKNQKPLIENTPIHENENINQETNDDFENMMQKFNSWLFKHELSINQESGFHIVPLSNNEIKSDFLKYQCVELGNQKFLNLFFEKIDTEWYLVSNCSNEPVDIEEYQEELQRYMLS